MNSTTKIQFGGKFTVFLTITFVILKALGYLNWSWFWVLSPTLVPIICVLLILFIILILKIIL